jgi:hopene-associated glycosyltransferase HpnB
VIIDLLAVVPVLIWLYLLFGRGGFWLIRRHLAPLPANRALAQKVIAIIPARNEAGVIADAVSSLLQQDFAGSIDVIVIDDESSDGTAEAALQAAAGIGASARLRVIRGAPLPSAWSGKLWAMSQGVNAAAAALPDYLLFTDADIHHDPDTVATLLTIAETQQRDLASFMVELRVQSIAEKALIPAFVFFFLKLYPPAWIASPASRVAGAAGGCILMRPDMLERSGGLRAIRSQIIDDCALARAVKSAGGCLWLGVTRSAHSTRPYGSFAQIGRMISRTAFNQLHHSYALLAATLIGLCLAYPLPPLLLLSAHPWSMALGGAAWALMCIAYAPTLDFYGLSRLWALGLPVIALFYAAATLHSAAQYWRGRGGEWKGRIQDQQLQ